jgi:hypothetical protein
MVYEPTKKNCCSWRQSISWPISQSVIQLVIESNSRLLVLSLASISYLDGWPVIPRSCNARTVQPIISQSVLCVSVSPIHTWQRQQFLYFQVGIH